MTELKKEFESKFVMMTGYQMILLKDEVEELFDWIEQKIDEACKKQREICANALDELEWGVMDNDIDANEAKTAILNAPSPKEIK